MIVTNSNVCKSSFRIDGVNNRIIIKEGAKVVYTSISIIGNGNEVVLDGCEAMLSILIRGNNCKVSVGKRSLLDESSTLIVMGQNNSIEIGEECMFAEHVEIWASDTHLITDLDGNAINPSKPIKIGNHVWLGKHVCVMKGVTIGDHTVVGLGSIVSKDIPSHCIAVGNPAKVVKNGTDWKFGFIEI